MEAFAREARARDGLSAYCKLCKAEYQREWNERNPDYAAVKRAEFLARHPGYHAVYKAGWRARPENQEREKVAQVAYRRRHPERLAARNVAWRKANPYYVRARNAETKAKARGAVIIASIEEVAAFVESAESCANCSAELTGEWHLDHIIPIERGGRHEISNLQPLCVKCHRDKTTRERGGRDRRKPKREVTA